MNLLATARAVTKPFQRHRPTMESFIIPQFSRAIAEAGNAINLRRRESAAGMSSDGTNFLRPFTVTRAPNIVRVRSNFCSKIVSLLTSQTDYLEARTSSEPAAQSSNELHRMCAESTSEPSDLNEVIKRQESIIASLTAKLAEKDRHFNSVLESMNVMHQVIQGSQLMHGTAHSIPTGNVQGSLNAFEPSPAPCFNATYPQPGLPIATSTAFGAIHSTGPPFDLSVNDFTPPTALPAAENTTSLREQADQTRPPNGSQKRPASPEASRSRKAIKVSAANQGSRPTLDQPSSSSREVDILSQMSLAKDTWHDLDDDNALKLLDPLQDVLNANFEWEFH
ncbi:uncharacterized protein K441DRAFT_25599 [Cenococcum geophilum 1.58]|uniref:uncharacterized protein n=1 Tax=Cenococcum geophilum 1.58 TaxID=794803 RepID=UPI00358E7472|nr:hypothetical protein K441DRAFT_25599 [Cenococcum geophilum 1.58]